MKRLNKLTFIALALPIISLPSINITSCNRQASVTFSVEEHPNYHSIRLIGKTQQLLDAGFEFGDSINAVASNGFKLEDVPYYSGYYTMHAEWQLTSYSKGEEILLAKNSRDAWQPSGLNTGDTITISINTKAKYLSIENNLNLVMSPDKPEWMVDEDWVNIHDVSLIDPFSNPLKRDVLYRGFSPVANDFAYYSTRRETVNKIAGQLGLNYDIDLTDTNDKMKAYIDGASSGLEWIKGLYNTNPKPIAFIPMGVNPLDEQYQKDIHTVVQTIVNNPGKKFYFHCIEGKDRTGFVFIVLEAFAGCAEATIIEDYMQTFVNLFNVEFNSEKYKCIKNVYYERNIQDLKEVAPEAQTLQEQATTYLKKCGCTDEELNSLKSIICK